VDGCLYIPSAGELPDPLPEILELIAERDVILNTGHLSAREAIRLVEEAKRRGVMRTLVPCAGYPLEAIREIASAGAFAEFSFFFLTHATQMGLTHVDEEKHTGIAMTLRQMAEAIRAATPQRTILSSDLGLFALPPPVEGFREFLVALEESGFSREELRVMSATNPAHLFRVRPRGQP
jgi:hypothetical protein